MKGKSFKNKILNNETLDKYYKMLFLIFTSMVIGFLIAYFWINDISFNAAAAASSAALVTALINWFMFLNQRKEFKKSFEPLLIPVKPDVEYEYSFIDGSTGPHSINWLYPSGENFRPVVGHTDKNNPYIPIKNIGRGTATDIIIYQEIVDYEKLVNDLDRRYHHYDSNKKENGRKINYRTFVEDGEYYHDQKLLKIVFSEMNSLGYRDIFYSLNYFGPQNFLSLPEKSENEFKLKLPAAFLVLANLCAYISSSDILPELRINIKANNLLGEEKEFNYLIKCESYNESISPVFLSNNQQPAQGLKYNWEFKAIRI